MPQSRDVPLLETHAALAETASRLFFWAAGENSPSVYLSLALPLVCQTLGAEYLALVRGEKGTWRSLATSGPQKPLPTHLLTEALDGDAPLSRQDWSIVPLAPHSGNGELLVAYRTWNRGADPGGVLGTLALWLQTGLTAVRSRQTQALRLARLAEILKISARWQQAQETSALLVQMAEASTRLLSAERATIFLWEKSSKMLLGRPALGVEGGELRIADNTGIVGQVIHSGEPRRVDADIEPEQREVDRQVDQRLKFQTHTLLCVPLRSKGGEVLGAFEAINKIGGNFSADDLETLTELATHASLALENTQQLEKLTTSRQQVTNQAAAGVRMIGSCSAILALRTTLKRLAETDLSVLILGENGTGKEVVAQTIHYESPRRHEPFVAVNCAALTETLLESELFGHEKGAFTDARELRRGKFELAAGGTLLLDEIGDMSLAGQAKLLRVLEEKVVVRVGGSLPIKADVRVLAATNQNLGELVRQKKFREDLFYRLSVVTLDLPPLRARGDDVLELAEAFLAQYSAKARRRAPKFTASAKKKLLAHPWPGNVRELRNAMERLAYLTADEQDKIEADDLALVPPSRGGNLGGLEGLSTTELTVATQQFQIQLIEQQIAAARGNMTLAAERLGLHRSNLYRKMRQLGLEGAEEG